jgi:peptide/nickel transport system substrate-binding protein
MDQLKTAPSGTGPFKFGDFQPGSSISFVRNPAYWLPGQPSLDAVRLVVIRDASAQQAALRAGAVDIITRLPPEAMLTLRAAPGVKLFSIPSGNFHAVMMQANMAPFDNPKVREAFKYLIDRPALRAAALFGQGSLGNDLPLPPGNIYLPSFPQRSQDLAKAKALLDESGVGKLTLDIFTTSERPPAPKMALALAEAAGKIGVTLTIRDVPYTEYIANVMRKKPLYTSSIGAAPTLFQTLYRMQHLGQPYNYGQEGDAATDALLDSMIGEPDLGKRKALGAQVLQHTYTLGEMINPYFLPYLCATSAKVDGFVPPRYNVIDVRKVNLAT